MTSVITKVLVALALVSWLGGGYLLWQRHRPLPAPAAVLRPENSGLPIGIAFPRLGLNLPVYPAKLTGQTWEYSDRGVSFWTDSALPGKRGNSVLYGHNWPNILGRLDEVAVGDAIEISLASGERIRFRVRDKRVVGARQNEILDQTDGAQLTVYTCVGFADRKRLVVVATPD